MISENKFPQVMKILEERRKKEGYCCVDFTESVTEMKIIERGYAGGYTAKFELFWIQIKFCPFCGESLVNGKMSKV